MSGIIKNIAPNKPWIIYIRPKSKEHKKASSIPISNKLNIIITPASLGPNPAIAKGNTDGIMIAMPIPRISKYGNSMPTAWVQHQKAVITSMLLISDSIKEFIINLMFKASLKYLINLKNFTFEIFVVPKTLNAKNEIIEDKLIIVHKII